MDANKRSLPNVEKARLKRRILVVFLRFASALIVVIGVFLFYGGPDVVDIVLQNKSAELLGTPATSTRESKKAADAPESDSPKFIQKTEIAKATSLQALDSDSLQLSRQAIALLELSPEKVIEVNNAITSFTNKLFAEEIARAFVEIAPEQGEEIVVPSFDRRAMHASFKAEITRLTDKSVAQILIDRVSHDFQLGASTTEIRLSIGDGIDGKTRINFTRAVLSEKAYDPDIPWQPNDKRMPTNMPAVNLIQTSSLLTDTIKPRIRGLLSAADKLPKKNK